MPDPVSQALQFWGNLDFARPTRDAQLAHWAQLLSDEQAKTRSHGAYAKAVAGLAEGDPDDAKLKGQSELVKILGQSGALDTSPVSPASPDQNGAQSRSSAANVQTFPLAPPPPIQGMQLPLTPPQGVAPVTPPAPGQASVPMQAPGPASLLPSHSQAFLAAQPPQARQAALQALLANAMGQRVTTRAPGAPAPSGASPASSVAPPGMPPGMAPAPAASMSPGWQPLRGPQTPQGSPTGEHSDLPLGGRGVQPARLPSVPMMAKKLLDSGLDPLATYYALQDYEKVQDRETKQAMEGLRTQANIYRAGLTAMRDEATRLRGETAAKDRAAANVERARHDRAMENRPGRADQSSSGPMLDPTGKPITSEAIDFYAAMQLGGDTTWRVGLSRSKQGSEMIRAVDNRVPELAREMNLSPGEVGTNKAKRAGLTYALRQRQNFVSAGNQYVRNLQSQADLVEKYMKAGVAGGVPALNRWIQSGRKSIEGDPDVVALDTALRGLAREHQRIVTGVTSNAQLHVAAQQTADELLNRDMTAAQIEATIKVMREEADNAIAAGRAEIGEVSDQLTALIPSKAGASSKSPAASAKPNLDDLLKKYAPR